MFQIRKSEDRGQAKHGWLDSQHTFSFASYFDPRHMGFRKLRVINEDRVAPGAGFGEHPHRDMEIISYVIDGALEHGDSMGTNSVIRPGEIQRMSAGRGVVHSEYNHSREKPVHFLQIWIETEKNGIKPSYEQKRFDDTINPGELKLIASRKGEDDSIVVNQDIKLYAGKIPAGTQVDYSAPEGRHTWFQMVRGKAGINGNDLKVGDGAASNLQQFSIKAEEDTEVLVFDLA